MIGQASGTTPLPAVDSARAAWLEARGYKRTGGGMGIRRRTLEGIAAPVLPARYALAEAGPDDSAAMADLLNAAFGRTSHTAAEFRTFATRSPGFDRALHLVAIGDSERFVAHVGVTLDPRNDLAIIEPVCTHPITGVEGWPGRSCSRGSSGLRRAAP